MKLLFRNENGEISCVEKLDKKLYKLCERTGFTVSHETALFYYTRQEYYPHYSINKSRETSRTARSFALRWSLDAPVRPHPNKQQVHRETEAT